MVDKDGYVYAYAPTHLLKNKDGYVMEHRLVMERYLGRILTREEQVHHVNGIKSDNRIENLMLMQDASEHTKLHNPRNEVEVRCAKCEKVFTSTTAKQNGKNPRVFCGSACTASNASRALWDKRRMACS